MRPRVPSGSSAVPVPYTPSSAFLWTTAASQLPTALGQGWAAERPVGQNLPADLPSISFPLRPARWLDTCVPGSRVPSQVQQCPSQASTFLAPFTISESWISILNLFPHDTADTPEPGLDMLVCYHGSKNWCNRLKSSLGASEKDAEAQGSSFLETT